MTKQKTWSKRALAGAMAVILSLAMGATAFAADAGNLTMYATDYTYTFGTYDLSSEAKTVDLMVTLADDSWVNYTGFSSDSEANKVTWAVESGSTLSNIDFAVQEPLEIDTGVFAAYAIATIPQGSASGCASLVATYEGQSVNVTVVVNTTTDSIGSVQYDASATDVNVQIYQPGVIAPHTKEITADPSNFVSTANGARSFPTVMDTMLPARVWLIDGYTYDDYLGYGVTVTSMKFGKDTYANKTESGQYFGWQYRMYRDGNMVEISEVLGVDDIQVQSGDTIMWKYGAYGEVVFPATI